MPDVHPQWRQDIADAFSTLDPDYRKFLQEGRYIPAFADLFNAFKSLPKSKMRYILFGQDPYPRMESATGHAFIDGAVETLFCESGLSKKVNRATSLRNFVKMALVAEGFLDPDRLTQEAIAEIPKENLIDSIFELRNNFENNGVLLLNAALVFEDKNRSAYHARAWRPFIRTLLAQMDERTELILFGNFAKEIAKIPEAARFVHHCMEHPYNHTFVTNERAHALFGPMRLLRKK